MADLWLRTAADETSSVRGRCAPSMTCGIDFTPYFGIRIRIMVFNSRTVTFVAPNLLPQRLKLVQEARLFVQLCVCKSRRDRNAYRFELQLSQFIDVFQLCATAMLWRRPNHSLRRYVSIQQMPRSCVEKTSEHTSAG